MTRTLSIPLLAATLLALTGCSTPAKNYDVLVTNRLSDPVTVWLTEQNPPYQKGWEPPEAASFDQSLDAPLGFRVIAPGMTGEANLSASIGDDNQAMLRIYRADHMAAILAISRGNPNRVDLPLRPGKTDLDVYVNADQLTTSPHAATRP